MARPTWYAKGDWFDVCSCDVPCPCTFAQAPTRNHCEGILAWHVREGRFGDVVLDGLNVMAISEFDGNIWAGAKATFGVFIDSRADEKQRQALQTIFGGQAGGWPANLMASIAEIRGVEVAPIEFEVAGDLAHWRAAIPGKVEARAEALTGPTTLPGKRVQVHNSPGCETGPGASHIATWGKSSVDEVDVFGWKWNRVGQSSKHIPFAWTGPG
jgi:hypothetical protein